MAYKLFSTGEVLTAANVNNYLMKQTVMVFADAATRTTALSGVLAEGMISYRIDSKVLEIYNGTSWVDFSGDITGVTAGTGLTGGGTSGTVTLTLDPTVAYGYSTTATAAGTTTLTATSNRVQMFTGTTTQTIALPVASTMTLGQAFTIHNNSTGSLTVQSSGANTVIVIPGGNTYQVTCILTSGTTAASWDSDFTGTTSTTGSGSAVLDTGATLTSPTINDATTNYPTFKAPTETANIVASAATGTINIDVETSTVWYYTTNATANHTLNFRYNSGTSLSSKLAVGKAITVVWMTPNGATAYYPNVIQIDGSSVTPKIQGGTAITGGNASATDIYSFTIIKTAATPTYLVLESQTKFV